MRFEGLLLEESLNNKRVLNLVKISKKEVWDVDNAAYYQPKKWTAIYFKGNYKSVDEIAAKFSRSLNPRWYINISTDDSSYVVFQNRVFKYKKGDRRIREKAVRYGQSVGIPIANLIGKIRFRFPQEVPS